MGLFRRGGQPAQIELDPAAAGHMTHSEPVIVGFGYHTDAAPVEAIAIDSYLNPERLIQGAEEYVDAWTVIDNAVSRLDFTGVISDFGDSVRELREDGSGRFESRRKVKKEDRDGVLMTVLSAHVAALPRDDSEFYPFLLSFSAEDYDPDNQQDAESLTIFRAMRERATYLQTQFERVERSADQIISPAVRFLQDGGDVDEFVSWLRDASTDENLSRVMQVLAQDIQDPERGRIAEAIFARISNDDTVESRERFADVIKHRDDGDFEDEVAILQLALRGLSDRRIDVDMKEFVRDISLSPSEWPQALRDSYSKVRQARMKEIKDEIHRVTSNFYVRSRRRPVVSDLQKLEKARITTPEEMEVAARTGKLPGKAPAKVPHDYVETPLKEAEPAKQAPVSWVTISDAKKRTVATELAVEQDDEAVSAVLLDDFMSRNKLDGSQRKVALQDIKKMVQALRMRATGNYGVTKIAEVKPFKDSKNRNHDVWRLNPAHYNGLSVSRMGKDMRVIYTLSGSGEVGIIGVYTHDDYTAMLKQLN